MEFLFFSVPGTLPEVGQEVSRAIGLASLAEGDSVNVRGGSYVVVRTLGSVLKVEPNSYDYEDDYDYMVTVYKDRSLDLTISDSLLVDLSRLIARLLATNLAVAVARETEGGLECFSPE